jgi:DNA-binding winged helix-turn-helix (wHTH) protein
MVDVSTAEIHSGTGQVRLQEKPFSLLMALVERAGQLVTRAELYERLWNGSFVDYRRSLDTAMRNLRRALGESRRSVVYIETLPRAGYRLIAPVAAGSGEDFAMNFHHRFSPKTSYSQGADTEIVAERGRRDRDTWFATEGAGREEKPVESTERGPGRSATVALAWILRAFRGRYRPVEAVSTAVSAALDAIRTTSGETPAFRVWVFARGAFEYDLRGSLRDWQLFQGQSETPWCRTALTFMLLATGRFTEARGTIAQGCVIHPESRTLRAFAAFAAFCARDFDEAVRLGFKAAAESPRSGLAHFFLGQALMERGLMREALAECEAACHLLKNAPEGLAILGVAFVRNGEKLRAWEIEVEIRKLSKVRHVDGYHHAILMHELGMHAEAMDLLEETRNDHSPWLALARVDPRLDPMRRDPRFERIARALHC